MTAPSRTPTTGTEARVPGRGGGLWWAAYPAPSAGGRSPAPRPPPHLSEAYTTSPPAARPGSRPPVSSRPAGAAPAEARPVTGGRSPQPPHGRRTGSHRHAHRKSEGGCRSRRMLQARLPRLRSAFIGPLKRWGEKEACRKGFFFFPVLYLPSPISPSRSSVTKDSFLNYHLVKSHGFPPLPPPSPSAGEHWCQHTETTAFKKKKIY